MSFDRALLGGVCEISMGQAPSGDTYNTEGEGLPLIAGAGDFGEVSPRATKFTTAPTKVSRLGEIILCIRATIGDRNWADTEYCLGRGVAGLLGKSDRLDQRYLWHWLGHIAPELKAKGRGATFLQVNKSDIGSLEIPLPSLREQRRIAAILDNADALRAKCRETIAKLDQIQKSVFVELFGDLLANPKGWNVIPLGECVPAINVGHVGPTSHGYRDEGHGIRFLRTQNVRKNRIDISEVRYISEEFHRQLRKSELRPSDVLVSRVGANRGMAAVVPRELEGANCANIVIVRSGDKLCPAYLSELINGPYGEKTLLGDSVGAAQGVINVGTLLRWKVPVPTIDVQRKFSAVVATAEKQQELKRSQLACLDALFNSLQTHAFDGTA